MHYAKFVYTLHRIHAHITQNSCIYSRIRKQYFTFIHIGANKQYRRAYKIHVNTFIPAEIHLCTNVHMYMHTNMHTCTQTYTRAYTYALKFPLT